MTTIRNSLWCVHKTLGLGMVGETTPVITFHPETNLGLGAPETVFAEDLRPAYADEVPAREVGAGKYQAIEDAPGSYVRMKD